MGSSRAWEVMLKRLKAFRLQHGHTEVPSDWYDQTLLFWVRTQRGNAGRPLGAPGRLSDDRRHRLEAIGFTFGVRDRVWEERIAQLTTWAREQGHADVPRFDTRFPRLGFWVSAQRVAKREGTLAPEHAQQLSRLGVTFELREMRWKERLKQLEAYRARHGHPNVPSRAKGNLELGAWLRQERNRIREGKVPAARVAQLQALGVWVRRPSVWDARIAELTVFRARHGHAHPQVVSSLGGWVAMQRRKLAAGKLTRDQVNTLKALGFSEKLRRRFPEHPTWKAKLALLAAFRKAHGHCFVPVNLPNLGTFVAHLRGLRVDGKLAKDMIDRLDALGFCWNASDAQFEVGFAKLAAFKARNGHALGPFAVHHPSLAQWVSKQRRYKARGKLSPERVARLEAIGLEWQGFKGRHPLTVEVDLVADFRRRNGHLAIPDEPPHRALYAWAREQRGLWSTGKLNPRIKADLIQLEFPFTRTELEWERKYASVRSQHERFGNLRRVAGELASWLEQQRRAQLAGRLTLAQEDRLLELGVFG